MRNRIPLLYNLFIITLLLHVYLIDGIRLYFVSVTTVNRAQGRGLNIHKGNLRYGGNCALTHVGLI